MRWTKKPRLAATIAVAAVAGLALRACSSSSDAATTPSTTPRQQTLR